jgi:hypothetical protein
MRQTERAEADITSLEVPREKCLKKVYTLFPRLASAFCTGDWRQISM